MRVISCLFIIVLLSLNSLDIQGQIFKGFFEIPRLNKAPVIDGEYSSKEWGNSVHFTGFTEWTLDQYIPEKTDVWMGYDSKYVYVAFRGYFLDKPLYDRFIEPYKPIDSHMWNRTNFSLGLSGPEGGIDLKCGPTLSRMDSKDGDLAWNGNYDFKASIHEDHWIGEYRIPFSDLDIDSPPLGEDWYVKFKHSNPSGQSSNYFGKIKFAESSSIQAEFSPWPEPEPASNQLATIISNTSKITQRVQVEIKLLPFSGYPEYINHNGMHIGLSSNPLAYNTSFEIKPGQTIKPSQEYVLPAEGNYYATVKCMDDAGNLIRQNKGYWFSIEPNNKKLNEIEKLLGEGTSILGKLKENNVDSLPILSEKLLSRLHILKSSYANYWENKKWDEYSEKVSTLETEISRFLHSAKTAAASNWTAETTFGITTCNSLHKIKKDKAFPGQIRDQISISAAGNEYESFQLILLPLKGDLENITLEISDLTGPSGKSISAKNIEVSLVEYNYIDWQASYVNNEKGWHPDPLIPIEDPISIDGKDLCRPIWVTLYVPEDSPAGNYEGEITVSGRYNEKHTAIIDLRVWDFNLPKESSLKTHTWDEIDIMADFYNMEEYPVDWYIEFCNVLLKNRLNPGFSGVNYLDKTAVNGKYDFSRVEKVLENGIEKGLNLFSMAFMKKGTYPPGELEKELDFIKAYADFLREKGWLDKAVVELWDEPNVVQWESVKRRAEKIRQISPDIRIQLFAGGQGPYKFWDPEISGEYGLSELIDIWAPPILVSAPELQKQGKEIWTYFCTLARSNAPNFYIDAPAIYQRTAPWYCWMGGVDAFEHWSTTYYWRNTKKGQAMEEKWPNALWDSRTHHDFHGEGQLVYPGPGGKTYASIRLEVFREGMEDYEYLHRLKALLSSVEPTKENVSTIQKAQELLQVEENLLIQYPNDVQKTLVNTIRDVEHPEKFLKIREKAALAIEELQTILNTSAASK